ncbi:MAG: EAL domain-containing protein [Algicola sp.]|nr:EAL domain-containing protein [Algicola sp.]
MQDKLKILETQQQHLSIVSEFAVKMLSLNTVDRVIWHLAQEVVAKLGFEDVVIYLMDEARQVLCQKAAFGDKSPVGEDIVDPIEIEPGVGVVGNAAKSKQPLLIMDTRLYPGYVVDDQSRLSELAVPMIVNDRVIGVIDSEHSQLGFFTEQQQQTLVVIASITATKIVETQAVIKLRHSVEQLEYASKIQDTLFEIAELIFQTECIDEFYKLLHACIGRLTFTDNFYVALASEDGKFLSFPYFVDEVDGVADYESVPIDEGVPGMTEYVLLTNKPLLVYESDIKKMGDKGIVSVRGSLPKAWLGVPFSSDELKGVVVVQSYYDRFVFKEKDKQLLVFVAKHIRNAIERMKAKSELKFLALHDPLTKLPNRLLFADRIEHAIDNACSNGQSGIAVLFLDLDRFKQVNDTYGHHVGDKLLIEVSRAISRCIRSIDTLSRFGGDEFAILLENISAELQIAKIAEQIIAEVQKPILIEQFQIITSTSIGVTVFQGEGITSDTLLKQADEAMYQAKLHGRNQVWHYDSKSGTGCTGTYKVERDFAQAIEDQDLFFEYQPLIDLKSGRIVGAEALVRWDHHEQGIIPPNAFLPELEKAGYIYQLDMYALSKALAFLSSWQNTLPPKFRLNVNISGAGFTSSPLLTLLQKAHIITPQMLHHLCIEIVEQSIVNSVTQCQRRMKELAAMGVFVALDDFGTGYSSLSYLQQFSFDYIKIDRSFIQNQDQDKDNGIILETIINLAKSLNIRTTAEGIETAEQYGRLKNMQCTIGQGYYMSRPISETDVLALIKSTDRHWAG